MSKITEITIGITTLVLGSWLAYSVFRNIIPSSIQIWWLPKEMEGKDFITRLLTGIVGFGFILIGLMFLVNVFI